MWGGFLSGSWTENKGDEHPSELLRPSLQVLLMLSAYPSNHFNLLLSSLLVLSYWTQYSFYIPHIPLYVWVSKYSTRIQFLKYRLNCIILLLKNLH